MSSTYDSWNYSCLKARERVSDSLYQLEIQIQMNSHHVISSLVRACYNSGSRPILAKLTIGPFVSQSILRFVLSSSDLGKNAIVMHWHVPSRNEICPTNSFNFPKSYLFCNHALAPHVVTIFMSRRLGF